MRNKRASQFFTAQKRSRKRVYLSSKKACAKRVQEVLNDKGICIGCGAKSRRMKNFMRP